MPGPLERRPPQQQQLQQLPMPHTPRSIHLLFLATIAAIPILSTPVQAFMPAATPAPPSLRHERPLPHLPSSTATTLRSSTGSGWRGGPRPDDEPVDLSGDGGVMKRVIRHGFGYKQESPPPHAYCKIAFVMKTSTGQVIADRMKDPMEFMLVRLFPPSPFSFHFFPGKCEIGGRTAITACKISINVSPLTTSRRA